MSAKSEKVGRSLRPRAATPVRGVAETFSASGPAPDGTPRRVKTSLSLDVELYRHAKIEAIQRGVTVSEFVENALRSALRA
jgi:hypothetical protein